MIGADSSQIDEVLHAHGLRVTPQRRAVWAAFDGGRAGHLGADDVFERARRVAPTVSRATIYNTLRQLVAAGVLATVDGGGRRLYDPNVAPHDHFRCRVCGRLSDVHLRGVEQLSPAEAGYVVERARVVLDGACPTCARGAVGE